MKPSGRALDIAVVGLGQAGGNIASEMSRRGYRALAINTAETDLAALGPGGVFPQLPAERRIHIGLDGYDGAGADPAYGGQCVAAHADRLRSAILDLGKDADVVLLAAGLGGGTGSALGTLVDVVRGANLPLVGLMTLPTEGESGIAKVNAVRAIGEIVDSPLFGWIFIDNARIAELRRDLSISSYYTRVNGEIVAPLDALNLLNDREDLKAIRSFDGEDFRRVLLSGGILNYAVAELSGISSGDVLETIRGAIETSTLMPSGFELTHLSYVGVVLEAPAAVLSKTPITVSEQIQELLKKETRGAAVYQGLYQASDDAPTILRFIAGTQSMPTRIRDLVGEAKKEGAMLGQKIREQIPELDLEAFDELELFRTSPPNRPSDRPRRNVSTLPVQEAEPRSLANVEDASSAAQTSPDTRGGVRRVEPQGQMGRGIDPRLLRRRLGRPREGTNMSGERARAGASKRGGSDDDPGEPDPGLESDQDVALEASRSRERSAESLANERPRGVVPDDALVAAVPTQSNILLRQDFLAAVSAADEPPVTPAIYQELVNAYHRAKQQRARDEVIRRLKEESVSDHAMRRYYAVQAMTHVGSEVFASALLAATEDENEAVRSLAQAALRR